MTFAAETFKVRNFCGHLQKTSLIIGRAERAKRGGNNFFLVLLQK